MAALDSCCCCSLLSAAIVIGFISSFLYGIAFVIELWWIMEAEGQSYRLSVIGLVILLVISNYY